MNTGYKRKYTILLSTLLILLSEYKQTEFGWLRVETEYILNRSQQHLLYTVSARFVYAKIFLFSENLLSSKSIFYFTAVNV